MKYFLLEVMVLAVCATAISCSPCKENVLTRISSAEYIATLSQRDCGAIGRASTLVSVRYQSAPDNDAHGVVIFAIRGSKAVQMSWKGVHHLIVDCPTCDQNDVSYEAVKSGDVVISYGREIFVGPS